MSELDPYLVLGIARDASRQEIRAAFRKAIMQRHPDTSEAGATGAADIATLLNAYRLLDDKRSRGRYDASTAAEVVSRGQPIPVHRVDPSSGATAPCFRCSGGGTEAKIVACRTCGGGGIVTEVGVASARSFRCPGCGGRGHVRSVSRCGLCGGTGRRSRAV